MGVDTFIKANKVLFLRTMCIMGEDSVSRRILKTRANLFNDDMVPSSANVNFSPVFEMLNASIHLGLYRESMSFIMGEGFYSKSSWKEMVWRHAWEVDMKDMQFNDIFLSSNMLYKSVMGENFYLTWWVLSDLRCISMNVCENMSKIGSWM